PTPSTFPLSLHDALPILTRIEREHALVRRDRALVVVKTFIADRGELEQRGDAGLDGIGEHRLFLQHVCDLGPLALPREHALERGDRKSTRLNSSHRTISY